MRILFAPMCLVFTAAAAPAQDDEGQLAFNNNCRTCHSLDADDNRLGPTLNGVVGREAGSVEGYSFSSALASADFEWDAESLDAFIENPDAVVPGHGMRPYSGITDPELRAAIVSVLGG